MVTIITSIIIIIIIIIIIVVVVVVVLKTKCDKCSRTIYPPLWSKKRNKIQYPFTC